MKKKIVVFLFDGFSDWEIAYLTPEINKSEQFDLVYFSKNGDVITSIGGLQIRPTVSLSELHIEDIDLLILPGGTAWENEDAFASGDTVAVFGSMNGTTTKSGKEIGMFTFALRAKVKDGKVVLWNWFEDSFAVSNAFHGK